MEQPKYELLVDYLDENLGPKEKSGIEDAINQDTITASELKYLKLAIETVRLKALNEKVYAVRNSMKEARIEQPSSEHVVVRHMYKTGLRIAAILVLLLSSAVLYKYLSVSNQSLYKNQFIPYDLS